MTRKFRINRKQKKQIEDAVARAEQRTSGEIVPMIVRQSHDYWWIHWYWAAVFLGLCSATLWWATSDAPWALVLHDWLKAKTDYSFWNITVHDAFIFQVCSALFGFSIAFFEPMKRMIVPKKWASKQVHEAALANFVACGLTETRDRTGVLIFISHLEHQVEIVADRGINEKTPDGFWQQQVQGIVKGIHRGQAADALTKAILQIGEKLAEEFPRQSDDTNELSNNLRLGGAPSAEPPSEESFDPAPDPTPTNEEEVPLPAAAMAAPPQEEKEEIEEFTGSFNPAASGMEEAPVAPPTDFPDAVEEKEDTGIELSPDIPSAELDETTNTNTEVPGQEPSDSPLGDLGLETPGGDTKTNFDITEMPSIHLDEVPDSPSKDDGEKD